MTSPSESRTGAGGALINSQARDRWSDGLALLEELCARSPRRFLSSSQVFGIANTGPKRGGVVIGKHSTLDSPVHLERVRLVVVLNP